MTAEHRYALTLPPDYGYTRYWVEAKDQSLVFRVRSQQEAHILVSAKVGAATVKHSHEIVLGATGNNYVVIRRGPLTEDKVGCLSAQVLFLTIACPCVLEKAVTEVGEVLSEHEYRTFWITWTDSVIAVGRGYNLTDTIVTWTDPEPVSNQKFVSFSAWDKSPAHFEIFKSQGT